MKNFIALFLICVLTYVAYQWTSPILQPKPAPAPVVVPTPAPEPIPIDNTPPTSFSDAVDKASKQNKKLVVIFHAEWCGYCQKLNGVLESSEVKEALAPFIVWKVDTDEDKNTTKKYHITGLPSYIILSPDGSEVKKGSGYKSSADFISWLGSSKENEVQEQNGPTNPL